MDSEIISDTCESIFIDFNLRQVGNQIEKFLINMRFAFEITFYVANM
jgi:coenzyme PQQ precursor peptide PqqA